MGRMSAIDQEIFAGAFRCTIHDFDRLRKVSPLTRQPSVSTVKEMATGNRVHLCSTHHADGFIDAVQRNAVTMSAPASANEAIWDE